MLLFLFPHPPAREATPLLPLPAATAAEKTAALENAPYTRPLHPAAYWAAKTRGFDFAVEDHLNTPLFNRVLWHGLMGQNVPYPSARAGRDLSNHRHQLLEQTARWRAAHPPKFGTR